MLSKWARFPSKRNVFLLFFILASDQGYILHLANAHEAVQANGPALSNQLPSAETQTLKALDIHREVEMRETERLAKETDATFNEVLDEEDKNDEALDSTATEEMKASEQALDATVREAVEGTESLAGEAIKAEEEELVEEIMKDKNRPLWKTTDKLEKEVREKIDAVDDVLVDDDLSKIGKAEEFTERTRKKTLREKLKEPGNAGALRDSSVLALAGLGLSMGTAHVLAGPDHLSALAMLSVGSNWKSFALGVRWGIGHSTGLLLVTVAFFASSMAFDLEDIAGTADCVVGVVMMAMGVAGGFQAYKLHQEAKRTGDKLEGCNRKKDKRLRRKKMEDGNRKKMEDADVPTDSANEALQATESKWNAFRSNLYTSTSPAPQRFTEESVKVEISPTLPMKFGNKERKNKEPKGGTISAYKRLMDKLKKQRDAHRTWADGVKHQLEMSVIFKNFAGEKA
eukprot:CAMPEP_0198207332 /NCGR_PEP_ID=MMETSP1445-20131203/10790_1 /TAXON_ID=36898 /ORGANISM="Pyramimonas sp., Strain CCMP2087" /LENGTH=456 /DNA_ID=CAMNT_0043880317 /DNA_START=114 /DNA_END=1481 /DNA_ORIENTATION=+